LAKRRYRGKQRQGGFTTRPSRGKKKASPRWKGTKIPSSPKPKGTQMPYKEYLRTGHWQKKRKKALQYFGYRCCQCSAEDVVLDVHHTHYEDLWREKLEDLRVVCRSCHEAAHK
jgi:hypothetical protein